VRSGAIDIAEACRRYMLTQEEYLSWQEALDESGVDGLRANMVAERRRDGRQQIEEAAIVLVNDAHLDCVIRDISPRGARLEFDTVVALPTSFGVHFERSGRTASASVIWQRDRMVGVRFETNPLTGANPILRPGTWLLGDRSSQERS
jgi:hypothetical protein